MVRFLSVLGVGVLTVALSSAAPLLLSDVLSEVGAVVYELPAGPDRAEVVRAIQGWHRVSPRIEIMDAFSPSNETLRTRIRGTFVYYTVLSENSRLLKLMAQPLPLEIKGDRLRWGNFESSTKGLRVIFVGRNPYGAGYSLVYAAGSTSLMKDGFAAARMIGIDRSYHIDKNGNLLREGTYDRNFAPIEDRTPAVPEPPLLSADWLLSERDRTVLWECPEGQDRAPCRHEFEQLRKQIRDRRVIDAASVSEAELRKRLRGPFVLLTILSEKSRLLRTAASGLPLRIENGTLHWQDVAEPIKDGLSLYFVGKSPYSNSHCLVGAIDSFSTPFRHADHSFCIYKGDKLLRDGFYDEHLAFRTAAPAPVPKRATLTQAEVLTSGFQVVYELPAGQDKAAFRSQIEKEFPAGMEILDADDPALAEKIKPNFMLLTILSEKSRLLRLTAKLLPLRVEGGALQWQDMRVPIDDGLSIHFIGKNPYREGFCLVFALGSKDTSASASNDSPSYGIHSGKKLLREGFYDRNFAFISPLTLADAIEDADQFFATLERAHPDVLRRVGAQEYAQLKQQIQHEVTAQAGTPGGIAPGDLGYILRYAAAFIGDGHTAVWSLPSAPNVGKVFPPFWLRAENGRYFLASAADAWLRDAEVLAVNGIPVATFLKEALDHISGETAARKAALFAANQSEWFSLLRLFDGRQFNLKLRDELGEREATVQPVDLDRFDELRPQQEPTRQTHVEFIEPGGLARLVYPGFDSSDEEKKKIDDAFVQIRKRKASDLIIDLRGNEGGDTSMEIYLFKYLYSRRFRNVAWARDKMSPENVLSHYIEPVSRSLGRLLASPGSPPASEEFAPVRQMLRYRGQVITTHLHQSQQRKPDAFFTGRVYLLIDNLTFSAATTFAAMFRDYRIGKILGQETGGTPTFFSSGAGFTLANSGVSGMVSCAEYSAAKPKPGDSEHGVLPDVPIIGAALAQFRNQDDPVLAFTLAYIRKENGQ